MCNKFRFDVAIGEDRGKRPTQEDFVFANFPDDGCAGLAVLSDGMGGYHDSVMASKFLVTGVAGELSADLDVFQNLEDDLPNRLEALTHFANLQLGSFIRQRRIRQTMGATLLSVAISRNKLFWASVGDSALHVIRDGEILRLNADHSMSPHIDFMVEAGMISKENANNHPDRSILTSAVYGKTIKKIDCPTSHYELELNDTVLLSSDGLETLGAERIVAIVADSTGESSAEITRRLLAAIAETDADEQDNTALVIIQVNAEAHDLKGPMPCNSKAPATPWSMALSPEGASKCAPTPEDIKSNENGRDGEDDSKAPLPTMPTR